MITDPIACHGVFGDRFFLQDQSLQRALRQAAGALVVVGRLKIKIGSAVNRKG